MTRTLILSSFWLSKQEVGAEKVVNTHRLGGRNGEEEDNSSDDAVVEANLLLNTVLWDKDTVEDQVAVLCHANDVPGSASSETYVEAEDEDNAAYHLCLLSRMTVVEDATFRYENLHMVLFAEVVAPVAPEVFPC